MAERTGIPALDEAIVLFIEQGCFNPDHPEEQGNDLDLDVLRDSQTAFTSCTTVSEQFADFAACSLGDDNAFLPHEPRAQALGNANRGEAWYPDVPAATQALGHCLTYLRSSEQIFTVDWSASQLGPGYADEFPLVQRLAVGGSWQRDF